MRRLTETQTCGQRLKDMDARLKEVEARLKEVEWQLHMQLARDFPGIPYPLENGLASKCIPQHLLPRFGTGSFIGHSKADPPLPPEHSGYQVGKFVFDRMEVRGSRPVWTAEIWDHLMGKQARGESISVPGYTLGRQKTWMLFYQTLF